MFKKEEKKEYSHDELSMMLYVISPIVKEQEKNPERMMTDTFTNWCNIENLLRQMREDVRVKFDPENISMSESEKSEINKHVQDCPQTRKLIDLCFAISGAKIARELSRLAFECGEDHEAADFGNAMLRLIRKRDAIFDSLKK